MYKAKWHEADCVVKMLKSTESSEMVDNFIQAVQDAPEILSCYAVTGDADFLLKIVVSSPESYDDFMHRFFFNLPGVRQTRTIVALKEIKNQMQLPLR